MFKNFFQNKNFSRPTYPKPTLSWLDKKKRKEQTDRKTEYYRNFGKLHFSKNGNKIIIMSLGVGVQTKINKILENSID